MKYIYILVVTAFFACTNERKISFDTFSREDISSSTLTPEVIISFDDSEDEDDFNIDDLFVYNDSIRIRTYKCNTRSKNLVKFYNINNPSRNKGYLSFGHGNMEMVDAMYYLNDNFLVASDVQGLALALFDVDSVFNEKYVPYIKKINTSVANCFVLKNKDIIYCNDYFLDYCSVNNIYNKDAERVLRLEREKEYDFKYIEYKDFTCNVGEATIISNDENDLIVSVSGKFPEITIMDSLFNVKRIIIGPDKFGCKLFVAKDESIALDKRVYGYSDIFKANNHVYLIYEGYEGDHGAPYDYRTQNYSLIKMDWDGNVKHIYQLQGNLYCPRIINDNELYGMTYINDKKFFVKYSL